MRGLFRRTASLLAAPPRACVVAIDFRLGERAVLLTLAATADHAIAAPGATRPDLIAGHGALGGCWPASQPARPVAVPNCGMGD